MVLWLAKTGFANQGLKKGCVGDGGAVDDRLL